LALLVVLLAAGCGGRQAPAPVIFKTPGTGRVAPPAAAVAPVRLTVKRGDTVYAISRRYRVSVRGVIDANRLRPPYKLLVGQVLVLPRERLHEVRRGDTLYGISRRYRVDMSVLARANGLSEPYRLSVGQRLRVPVVAAAPSAALKTAARAKPAARVGAAPQRRSRPAAAPAPIPSQPIPKPPPRSKGSFLWPVQGKLVSSFGPKGDGLHNDGINIAAPRGAAVRAAEDGVVAYAGNELRGYGNLLLVRHAGGWTTAYAHNQKLLVRRGDAVRRGQVIARVGSSGNVATPQTHFELRRGTRAVDPVKSLASN
jgi:murein DD-endopeptidase MepM/ murein hydrolase activator NlpD